MCVCVFFMTDSFFYYVFAFITIHRSLGINQYSGELMCNIYIFIAIALDESIFLDVLHFPMKNIKSHDLEATPMGGSTSKPIQ